MVNGTALEWPLRSNLQHEIAEPDSARAKNIAQQEVSYRPP